MMGKDIGRIYKHGKSQHSTMSIKELIISYSASQILSSIGLTITSVSSVIEKIKPIPFCIPKIPSRMI